MEEKYIYVPRVDESKHRFSKTIVVLAVLSIYLYTATSLYFAWHYRVIPPEVTVGYFTFWGVEMLALAYKHTQQRVAELSNYNPKGGIL